MQLIMNAHEDTNEEKQEDKEDDKEFKEMYKGVTKRSMLINNSYIFSRHHIT